MESIKWADEILVVDSYSTDATLDICRDYGARVIQHEYINSAKQKNWALPQCQYEWVLQVDSDEVLGLGLREEIVSVTATAPANVHAFRMARRNHFLGRWTRYGGQYPDYQVRLFRRDSGRWAEREVHARVVVPGEVRTLNSAILHYDAPCISKRICNLDRYTRYEADEMRKRRERFRWYDLLIRPGLAFLYRYVWLQGFRDGWRGLIYCSYIAMYVFLAHAKLWELEVLGLERSPDAGGSVSKSRKCDCT